MRKKEVENNVGKYGAGNTGSSPHLIDINGNTSLTNSECIFSQLEISQNSYNQLINPDQPICNFDDMYISRTDYIFTFTGLVNKTGIFGCEKYDITKNEWKEIKAIPQIRTQYGLCYRAPYILIFGGKFVDGNRTDTFIQYNTITDQWENCDLKLPRQVSSFAYCIDESKLYICGGSNGKILSNFECLDLTTQKWITLPDMVFKRKDFVLVKGLDNNLYAIGGSNGDKCLNICERFSIQLFKWEMVNPMLTPSRSLACVVMPDGIYALGGYDGTQYLNLCEK
jgi:hypothetical protein